MDFLLRIGRVKGRMPLPGRSTLLVKENHGCTYRLSQQQREGERGAVRRVGAKFQSNVETMEFVFKNIITI